MLFRSMAGVLLLLARERAVLSVALLGCWVGWIRLGTCGINDQLPALCLLAGLLLVERRARRPAAIGIAIIAAGTAIKPYLAAWAPAIAGYAGLWTLAVFAVVGITVLVISLLGMMGDPVGATAGIRILATLIACAIALLASLAWPPRPPGPPGRPPRRCTPRGLRRTPHRAPR